MYILKNWKSVKQIFPLNSLILDLRSREDLKLQLLVRVCSRFQVSLQTHLACCLLDRLFFPPFFPLKKMEDTNQRSTHGTVF